MNFNKKWNFPMLQFEYIFEWWYWDKTGSNDSTIFNLTLLLWLCVCVCKIDGNTIY